LRALPGKNGAFFAALDKREACAYNEHRAMHIARCI